MTAPSLYIGLMSGTSLDGIDAALIEVSEEGKTSLVEFINYPYPTTLKDTLYALNLEAHIALETLCQLEQQIGVLFAEAANQLLSNASYQAKDIVAIGSHGQTIYHAPQIPMSLQIGHPAFIAKQTGITTVADFRIDDMANGGEGAPLAPAFHASLFAKESVLVNIGGIANISYIGEKSFGYDTGPGNALMDEICAESFNQPYDKHGEIAATSAVDRLLLDQLLEHSYFAAPFPKSTGRETFNRNWLDLHTTNQSPDTLISTLNQLTATSIANEINRIKQPIKHVWICGGGAHNQTLIQRIQAKVTTPVQSISEIDVNPDALEAMMCGWLAYKRLHHQPVELSDVTGAKQNSVLGGIFHP